MHRSFITLIILTVVIRCTTASGQPPIVLPDSSRSPESSSRQILVSDCRISAHQRVTVSSENQGVLTSVAIAPGDSVAAESLLAQLKDTAARMALETAKKETSNDIDLRYAQKLSELSNLEYARALQLNREIPGAKPDSEVMRLKLAAERAALQVEQAAHDLELAELRRREAEVAVASFRLLSPMSGTVLHVHHRAGESVRIGDPLAEIANLKTLRVEGFIPAAQSWKIHKGDQVSVQVTGLEAVPDIHRQRFSGKVTFIDPVINEVSQSVRIWAEIDNSGELLRDGMLGEMLIFSGSHSSRQATLAPELPVTPPR